MSGSGGGSSCGCGARPLAGSEGSGAPGDVPGDGDVVVVGAGLVAGLDDEALLAAVARVEAAGRRVDAARVALAAEVAHRSRRELGTDRLSARRGCRTGVELVQRLTGASTRAVTARVRLGAATRAPTGLSGQVVPARFPAVAWALDQGVLGADGAAAVVDTLTPAIAVAGTVAVQAAEAAIITGAAAPDPHAPPALDADCVRVQATVWRAVLDPDGTAPTHTDTHRRGLTLGTTDHGLVRIRGLLLPEVAAALERYAHAWTNPRTTPLPDPTTGNGTPAPNAPGTDAADPSTADRLNDAADPAAGRVEATATGAGPGADDQDLAARADRRTGAQLLHDVLATIVTVAARAADAPSVAGNAPTLVVTVRHDDLTTGRGIAWAGDRPVSLATATHTGCAGAVETVIVGSTGRIVGLGSRDRCFTGQQRRAITLRDRGCIIPGCHVPAAWCEVHHVTPHAQDPTGTHTDNGVLLCWHHHRTLDTSGWHIRTHAGLPQILAPRWLDPDQHWRTPGTLRT